MPGSDSLDLLANWRDGDDRAGKVIFDRYVNQLVSLASNLLSDRMRRRVDADDIVQSTYRTFFRKAADNHYTLEKRGDLWRLLAAITVSKIRGQVEFHTAKKRDVYSEEREPEVADSYRVNPTAVMQEPTPGEAVALAEELIEVTDRLSPLQRQIVELTLENRSIDEIADEVKRSARTVRRTMQKFQEELERRLLHNTRAHDRS